MGGRGTGSFTASGVSVGGGGGIGGTGTDLNVAGWTPNAGGRGVSADNTIEGIKNRIQNLDHEQLAIVDKYGYVINAVDGEKHSVALTPKAEKNIKGNDVYHNHPSGGTLSTTDVITAGLTGAGSISAISKSTNKTYTLRAKKSNANGKGLAKAMQKDEKKLLNEWQSRANAMKGRKYSSEASWRKQVNRHWDNIMSDWMSSNASKYGYEYAVK